MSAYNGILLVGGEEEKKNKLKEADILQSDRLDKLLLNKEITTEMATSLLNDSYESVRLTKLLIDVALILHEPKDELIEMIDDHEEKDELLN